MSELEIAERQLVAIAEAIPEERYAWRPDIDARSVSEVFVHIAAGNFLLLDRVGISAPLELYGNLPSNSPERLSAIMDNWKRFGSSSAQRLRSKREACMAAQLSERRSGRPSTNRRDHLQIVEELLDAGAHVEDADYPTGHEPIDAILERHGRGYRHRG